MLTFAFAVLPGLLPAAQDEAAAEAAPAAGLEVELRSPGGQTLRGSLAGAAEGLLGLRVPEFRDVLEIRPGEVERINVRPGPDEGADEGPADELADGSDAGAVFAFALHTGDELHARVLGIDAEEWSLDALGVGEVRVGRSQVASVENLGGGALAFNGPAGIGGWEQKKDVLWGFDVEAGELAASDPKAQVLRDVGVAEGTDVTLGLRWDRDPRFRIALDHDGSRASMKQAVTLEPWGESLVAWRDNGDRLEVTQLLQGLGAGGSLELVARMGPERIEFLGPDGAELGSIGVSSKRGGQISLLNDGEHTAVTMLRVLATEGEPLVVLDAASVTGFTEGEGFVVAGEAVPAGTVLSLAGEAGGVEIAAAEGALWLEYKDGRRIGGILQSMTDRRIDLLPAWSQAPIACSLDGLGAVGVVPPAVRRRRRATASFLVTPSGAVEGHLDSIDEDGSIVWNPSMAAGTATLDPRSVERIVVNRTTAYFVSGRKFPHRVHLQTGEAFSAKLLSMSEDSIVFDSPFGSAHRIGVGLLKAVEIDTRAMARYQKAPQAEDKDEDRVVFFGGAQKAKRDAAEAFDTASLERALALPRKFKRRAPKNLLVAKNGDFLRTSISSWADEGARVDGRSDSARLIPGDRVAALIWLAGSTPEGAVEPGMARVVLDEQTRINLELSGTQDGKLVGTSDLLGELRIDLRQILSIELESEALAKGGPYAEWVLKPMREPFPDDPDAISPSAAPGVGEPAHVTIGTDLEGKDLSLADFKGEVVLLDFWGHW